MTRKNTARHLALFCPAATLASCLLATIGPSVYATEPVMPDVNQTIATPEPAALTADPVSELPPAPFETAPASNPVVSGPAAKALPVMPNATIYKVSTPNTTVVNTATTKPKSKAWNGEPLHDLTKRLNVALPLPQGRIVINKAQRRLDLYNGDVLLKSYNAALGPNPVGAKQEQGDGRTPEGQFYICTRNSRTSAFHIFLGLSYPALPDAKKAVKKKTISPREFQIIRQRLASRGAPPWETRLGGWVGIHGGTDAAFAKRTMKTRKSHDWTAGCVGLTNREIDELFSATIIGTPVLVKP